MLDQIISAGANLSVAFTGLLVVRAYYPRNGWPLSLPARAFHAGFLVAALAAALNAGAWFAFRMSILIGADDLARLMGLAFRYGDGFWKVMGAGAFLSLLLAKLSALDPEERDQWNIVSVAFHPDGDALFVRICNATAGATGRIARTLIRNRKG